MASSSSGGPKVCFNSSCNQALEVPRQGWLCRTGDFVDLCDRCAAAFENGRFCDTYHVNASGWRSCESCGKQIHCGCIVSSHMFILLDAGGIECIKCAKTEYILTLNPTWPSAPHILHGPAEKISDISSKSWRSIAESGPVPWRQAPSLFNAFKGEPELPVISCSLGQNTRDDPSERFVDGSSWISAQERIGDIALASRVQYDRQHNLLKDVSYQSFFHTNAVPFSSLPTTCVLHDKKYETENVSGIHVKWLCTPPLVGKQCSNSNGSGSNIYALHHDKKYETGNVSGIHVKWLCTPPSVGKQYSNSNGAGPSLKKQAHNAKALGETRAPHQPLPRYWPQSTDQELQQLSGCSNAKIIPLFEKVLSASDTAKIGRLVLPKKCAEAYLPPISQPEGCPLVIQDLQGKDWVLQYRFWTNNNSRMYVLEGATPCIQSMQLQAGDTVTFSRLEPEGKLVMGFKKASLASLSDKGNNTTHTRISSNKESLKDGIAFKQRNPDGTCSEVDKNLIRISSHKESLKDGIAFKQRNPDGTCSEVDKNLIRAKRKKGGKMCSNSKKFKLKEEEMLQFTVTLEQIQGLLLPPLADAPTVVLIEGVEFEGFQEAPIIGSPSTLSTENVGSLCSTEVEPTPEHLEHMPPMINHENPESLKTIEGLNAFADLAVHDGKAATRHPCHKRGCMCILCLQPPNSTKHKSTCTCNICLALNHLTPSVTMQNDPTRPEHQVGNSVQNPTQSMYADIIRYTQMRNNNMNHKAGPNQSFENDPSRERLSLSTFKNQKIDLNIQPAREEEPYLISDSMGIMMLVQESTQRYIKQQKLIDQQHN